jgi:hypothetical protein
MLILWYRTGKDRLSITAISIHMKTMVPVLVGSCVVYPKNNQILKYKYNMVGIILLNFPIKI